MKENLLNDKRRMWKYVLFGILTLGIYDIIFWWKFINDINIACGYVETDDDEKSPNYIVFVLLSIVTLGIYSLVWYYKQGNRIKSVAEKYKITTVQEKGLTYLLWIIVGLWLFGVGPFVAIYLLICNVNKVCRAYNREIEQEPSPEPLPQPGPSPEPSHYDPEPQPNPYISGPTIPIRANGRLQFIAGALAGTELDLDPNRELIIGRDSRRCQLVLADQDISRRHCAVKYMEGAYYVRDLGSSFGVFINDSQRLESEVNTMCPVGTTLTLAQGSNKIKLV